MTTTLDERTREIQLADEADEQRWLEATFEQLDAENPYPPF